jgi:hypothetical protein
MALIIRITVSLEYKYKVSGRGDTSRVNDYS